MTPIDSLLAAKKAIAASEAAELAKDYLEGAAHARQAIRHLQEWVALCSGIAIKERRDKGLADVTEVMAEQYRADNRA